MIDHGDGRGRAWFRPVLLPTPRAVGILGGMLLPPTINTPEIETPTASATRLRAAISATVSDRPTDCAKCGRRCEVQGSVRVCFDCDAIQLWPQGIPILHKA